MAPHLGIRIPLFWISTFFGIFAVSVIHVTIGEKLDQMTSANDFNLFSVRNILLLGGVIIAVLIPVAVRKYSQSARSPLEEDVNQQGGRIRLSDDVDGVNRNVFDSDDENDDELPRVNLRGAASHLSDDGASEEGRAAYVARAWRGVELDADQRSEMGDAGILSDDENSVPVFEDRREQQSPGRRRFTHDAPTTSTKARRILGLTSDQANSNRDTYTSRVGNWVNWATSW